VRLVGARLISQALLERILAQRPGVSHGGAHLHRDLQQRRTDQIRPLGPDDPRHHIRFTEPHQNGDQVGHALLEGVRRKIEVSAFVDRPQLFENGVAQLVRDDVVGQ
jgi:hypothetical protein